MKTNAARLLDKLGISYEIRTYEVDPEDLTAISVARKIEMPIEQVFKTLLTHTSDGEHLFAVIPGGDELDLKKLAAAAGARKAELAALKEVEPLTGYVRGGVTVLARRSRFVRLPMRRSSCSIRFRSRRDSAGSRLCSRRLIICVRRSGSRGSDQGCGDTFEDARMSYFGHVLTHLRKDLQLEWRARELINGMLFFALLVVVVFSLAFDPTAYPTVTRQISGGLLWVGLLFASITALNQSWARELHNQVLDAQRLSPAPASALFLGKALANLIFVSFIELVLAPVFAIFYNLHPLGQAWLLLVILPLGTWGLTVNGTFFAALSLRTRNRELLLPLILCPIAMPALLAMIQATTNVLTGEYEPGLWIKLLVGYDVVFTIACIFLFETVLEAGD